ncbi:heme-binding protein [Lysobacter sp. BMK333-48F3]|uniref:GlcG/HbpS family heme-binding protein n=1 Tax=Lysobacter sp. BMK333-48F3 TaxID=2867962 RepID=UPI001C8C27C9|nr:heme-binding protein [Lysobacter sp. BMK333-48F3]MBX9402386.1 heme-binding protein [Lysobacter sp. BMK333-48F3]
MLRLPSVLLVAALASASWPSPAATPLKQQLSQRTVLNLAAAQRIAQAAEDKARADGLNVAIAIVDEAGRLLHFQRMDGTPNSSVEVSIGKAVHATNYRRDSVFHQKLLEGGNAVVLGLPNALPIEGGVRLLLGEQVIGAIGVSGAQAAQDGAIAQAGADLLRP